MIERRKSKPVWVGSVQVGGDAPVSVQSMTNTQTTDVEATCEQITALCDAGADIVRVSIPDTDACEAFGAIRKRLPTTPLVVDIHFDYRLAIASAKLGANCLRINPGNIGKPERIQAVLQAARDHNIPLRIGINAGSLERDLQEKYGEPNADALVDSALRQIDFLDRYDFTNYKLSLKASNVHTAVAAYRKIATLTEQPLHLGITEAGSLSMGSVRSSVGLGILLFEGIGDTIRVSLASDPVDEVKVGFSILKSLNIRNRGVNLIACPSCSRQNFNVIAVTNALESRLEDVTESIDVAVIGCVVNGPGEAKEVKFGLTGGKPKHLFYEDGVPSTKVSEEAIVDFLEQKVRREAESRKKD